MGPGEFVAMFNYAGAFVGICIVRPGEFVYIRLIMLVHLLGRPGEFVYIHLIMLVNLLDMHCGARRICLHRFNYTGCRALTSGILSISCKDQPSVAYLVFMYISPRSLMQLIEYCLAAWYPAAR